MPEDIEAEVDAMMAHGASLDMAYPWTAVKSSMAVMDTSTQVAFMEQLHEQLLSLGLDPLYVG